MLDISAPMNSFSNEYNTTNDHSTLKIVDICYSYYVNNCYALQKFGQNLACKISNVHL